MKRNFILLNAICCLFSSNMALADASGKYFNLVQSGEALNPSKRFIICLDATSYDCQNYTVTHENVSISSNIAGHTYKKSLIKTTESTPKLMSLAGLTCNSSGTECDFEISDTTSVVAPVESSDQSKYFLGGSISGLPQATSNPPTVSGLVLHNSENDDDISVPLGAKSYVFNTRVSNSNAYQISVSHNPDGYSCTVAANYKGTVNNDNVSNINIECNKASTSQWHRVTSNIATQVVTSQFKAFAVAPSNSQTVYVATNSGSVFKSTDGSLNWTDKSHGLYGTQIWSIKVDPFNSNIVYLASNSGIFKSSDAGDSWKISSSGLPIVPGAAFSVTLDPSHQDTLYAGFSDSKGIYKSINGGATWQSINSNLPATGVSVYSIVIKPDDSNVLYIGTNRTHGEITPQSIFRTDNAGLSWVESDAGIADTFGRIYSILINPTNSDICYAATGSEGAYKSIDGCKNWHKIDNLNKNIILDMVFSPADANTLIAGTDDAIYKTVDAASNWIDITGTLTPASFYALSYSGSTLLQGTLSGELFRSLNNGSTWETSSNGIVEHARQNVHSILVNQGSIIAAFYDQGIFKSVNETSSWTDILNPSLSPTGLYYLQQDPLNKNVIYIAADEQGVFKTTDGGVTWLPKNTGFPAGFNFGGFAMDPTNSDTLFVNNTEGAGGLFKSINGGDSWTLLPFFNDNSFVHSIAIDKNDPQIIFATKSIDNTIAKSSDGGDNWTTILSTTFEPRGVSIDPQNSDIIYVAAAGNIIYKSLDSGANWTPYSSGLIDGTLARTEVTVDPKNSQHLYLGTNKQGVYYSVNGGKSWSLRSVGLEGRAVNVLKFDAEANYLYAGTLTRGIFRIVL